jgi:hypothetical protein
MAPLKRDEAFEALEQLRSSLQARIPPTLPAKGRKYLGYVVEEQMAAARLHLEAIYESDLAVGPDFAEVPRCLSHPKYAFWLAGVRRHIQHCEASLGRGNMPLPGSGV